MLNFSNFKSPKPNPSHLIFQLMKSIIT